MKAPEGLDAFFAREFPRVRGSVALYIGDWDVAADLTQEAFVRACRDWERVERLGSPGAWVHRVAMNLATSRLRRQGAERRALSRLGPRAVTTDEDPSTGPAVAAALELLPMTERAVVVLRFYSDLSVEDTAESLGIPNGTVKTRTRRALARLRELGWTESAWDPRRLHTLEVRMEHEIESEAEAVPA